MLAFLGLLFRRRTELLAENLSLRKQLALFKKRKAKPRPAPRGTRLAMIAAARFFDWRDALVIVKPATFIQWHRTAFKLFWRWKSRKRGRPPLPLELCDLIREMHRDNPTWGEERIASELSLKLGIRVSPATVRKYLRGNPSRQGPGDQRWSSPPPSASCTCSWPWRSARAAFSIPT